MPILLRDPEVVLAALHPLRRRLLEMMTEPTSASRLAEQVGLPRQKVNYHLRALEADGLIQLVEERPRRGLTERMLARADTLTAEPGLLIDPGLLVGVDVLADPRLAGRDRVGLGGVMAAASSLLRHAATVGRRAADANAKVAAVTLDATVRLRAPADLRALVDDLAQTLARHDSPDDDGPGLAFRVTCTALPQLADEDPEEAA